MTHSLSPSESFTDVVNRKGEQALIYARRYCAIKNYILRTLEDGEAALLKSWRNRLSTMEKDQWQRIKISLPFPLVKQIERQRREAWIKSNGFLLMGIIATIVGLLSLILGAIALFRIRTPS
jgi:hypothetical protein